MDAWKALAGVAVIGLAGMAQGQPEVYGDSVAEFSGVQTINHWDYGFYNGDSPLPWSPVDFEFLPVYDGGLGPVWYRLLGAGGYWTAINATAMQPNGSATVGGRINEENWVVRRWLATKRLPARIVGRVADVAAGAPGSNGVTCKIFVNGTEAWSRDLEDGDTTGIDIDVPACLYVASPIDFVVTPRGPSDLSDGTIFTVKIQSIIDQQPVGKHSCGGSPVTLSVGIGGTGAYGYQWRRGGVDIQGATLRNFTILKPSPLDEGEYDCVISAICGSVTTTKAVVTVCAPDLNCDEIVDFSDYLEFLNRFDTEDPRADINNDGFVDFADYLEFLNQFDAGC